MILMLHILIALATIGGALYAAFRPSSTRISAATTGMVATLMSGVLLVALTPTALPHACVSGVVTLAFAAGFTYYARQRMALSR